MAINRPQAIDLGDGKIEAFPRAGAIISNTILKIKKILNLKKDIDPEEEKFHKAFRSIRPADGSEIRELEIKDLKIPTSFNLEEFKGVQFFRMNGARSENNEGFNISGHVSGDIVEIDHILLSEGLRGGTGSALLAELENRLKEKGIKTIYPTFHNVKTIEFFLKNGYTIVSFDSLKDAEKNRININGSSFDNRIGNSNDFDSLKASNKEVYGKVLLKKVLA